MKPCPRSRWLQVPVNGPLTLGFLIMSLCMSPLHLPAQDSPSSVEFSRDILPLLSENCFQCHGPDEATREAGLRLDQRDGILAEADSGAAAVIPGSAVKSELVRRIISDDPDLKMPPPESGKKLTAADIERLKQWVNTGAKWSVHWAYEKQKSHEQPTVTGTWKHSNPIDLFIQNSLKQSDLSPSQQASKETLIRRATLDLTGLPPTIEEIDQFLSDDSPEAYERVLDRVMESPAYAEHMTGSGSTLPVTQTHTVCIWITNVPSGLIETG